MNVLCTSFCNLYVFLTLIAICPVLNLWVCLQCHYCDSVAYSISSVVLLKIAWSELQALYSWICYKTQEIEADKEGWNVHLYGGISFLPYRATAIIWSSRKPLINVSTLLRSCNMRRHTVAHRLLLGAFKALLQGHCSPTGFFLLCGWEEYLIASLVLPKAQSCPREGKKVMCSSWSNFHPSIRRGAINICDFLSALPKKFDAPLVPMDLP
jgi:hypothetical protein